MKELYLRWKAKTPLFWKKVMRLGGSLLGFSALVFGSDYFGYAPEYLVTMAKHSLTAGIVLTTIGKFAVEDKEDIK